MKTNLYRVTGLLILFMISAAAHAQREGLDSIVSGFRKYRENAYQEKLYVHLHRKTLLTGEMLWFKVYGVDGTFHKSSDLSKVAYVEIIDRNNRAVLQSKIQMTGKGGNGSIFIPATILTGNYTFRAYTNWMKNFHPDFFFNTTISVINPFVKPDVAEGTPAAPAVPAVHAEFFPEGGNLIEGHLNRMAFKVTAGGEAVSGKLFLVTGAGDTLSTAEVNPFGLGRLSFTPVSGVSYRALFVNSQNHSSWHSVPKPQPQGYALLVTDSAGSLFIRVSSNAEARELQHTYLVVHARQQIIQAETKPLYPKTATYVISKSRLPDGITHLTVFDGDRRPVCERLFFTIPKKKLDIAVSSDRQEYGVRRKVSLQVASSLPAGMSVSVYKVDSITSQTTASIQEYIWLTSDLRGKVDSPEYYFDSANERVEEYADILMMTHGWRRFAWNDVLTKKQSERNYVPEVRGHLITGQVLDAENAPAPGVLALMSSPGKVVKLYASRSNSKGELLFEAPDFFSANRIVVQTSAVRDSSLRIVMRTPFSSDFSSITLPTLTLDPRNEKELTERSISMQLHDIYAGERFAQTTIAPLDSFPFYGKADESFLLDTYTRFPVLEEVMREYVPGVLVRKRKDGFHFIVVNNERRGVLGDDPLVLLDGIPVKDVDDIMAFSPLKIKKLDVIMRHYYLGPMVFSGVVSFSTYDGDLGGFELDPRAVSVNYEGLQLQRQFYLPQYENLKQRNTRIADQRNLLYWSPDLVSKAGGKNQIDFFTSDLTGNFIVVVEGLADNGAGGHATSTFSVKKTDY